jgi:predicted HicB family RNase H-like nuclease
MKKKTNKLPDFSKMTRAEEADWFDTHDMGDYWDELEPVDVVVELSKPKEETLVLRVNKDVKKKLEQKAKDRGITISTLARILLTEKLRTI